MNLWVVHFGPQHQRYVISEDFAQAVVMAENDEGAHSVGGHMVCSGEKMIVADECLRRPVMH